MSKTVRLAGTFDLGLYFSQSQSNLSSGTMTLASSGSIVAYGKFCSVSQRPRRGDWLETWGRTAGLPKSHFVMAWKRVDFPTLARPTLILV
jgi:hypothetical protein